MPEPCKQTMASVSIAVQEELELDRLTIRFEIDQVKFSQTITNTYNLRSSGFAKQSKSSMAGLSNCLLNNFGKILTRNVKTI